MTLLQLLSILRCQISKRSLLITKHCYLSFNTLRHLRIIRLLFRRSKGSYRRYKRMARGRTLMAKRRKRGSRIRQTMSLMRILSLIRGLRQKRMKVFQPRGRRGA